jgi:hypothetical protein
MKARAANGIFQTKFLCSAGTIETKEVLQFACFARTPVDNRLYAVNS